MNKKEILKQIIDDSELLEVARKAIEDTLIEFRDSHISTLWRSNGLVIREKDGTPSNIIRFGPEIAIKIGLEAIIKEISK